MLRGVCGKWGCLAPRGWAGVRAGPLASLHRHIEELKLEEPCEEWAVVLQPPGKKKMVRRKLSWSLLYLSLKTQIPSAPSLCYLGQSDAPYSSSYRRLLYARATFPEIRSEPKTTTRSVEALGSSSPLRKGRRR